MSACEGQRGRAADIVGGPSRSRRSLPHFARFRGLKPDPIGSRLPHDSVVRSTLEMGSE